MKCRPLRWLWGLLPIALLAWITMLAERGRIEADLHKRTQQTLANAKLPWATSAFTARDLTLSGTALEEGEQTKAVREAMSVWGVRVVDNRTGLLEKAEQYNWSASIEDGRLKLKGFVPSENDRKTIIGIAKASFPKLEIDDRMKLARGAPAKDAWLGGISFGFKQLERLKAGRVDLDTMALTVAGEAADGVGYKAVKTALGGRLPTGVSLKQDAVTAPLVKPYTWAAKLDGGSVSLSGFVPSEKVKSDVAAIAKRTFPSAKVSDATDVGGGAPEGFATAVAAVLGQLAQLEQGTAEIRDTQLTFRGQAREEATATAVQRFVRNGLPPIFKSTEQVTFRLPTIKPVSPFTWSAALESGAVILRGFVPSEEARASLIGVARARFPGMRMQDELALARGEPEGWQRCMEAALVALNQLGNGRAQLIDRRLVLTGETQIEALVTSVPGDLKSGARGCETETRIAYRPSPEADAKRRAEEEAKRKAEEEAAKRLAVLPDDAKRKADEDARQKADDEARRRAEEMRLAEEAKRRAEQARLQEEARKAEEARRLAAEQEARRKAEEEARRAAAEKDARQKGAQAAAAVAAQRARDCQVNLASVARAGVIRFSRASADIDPASFPTLQELARVANQCPEAIIEIGGHTDSDGTAERNQRLSERRAQSVAQYLVSSGVDSNRLQAVGYGQDRPVAPNDTNDNKARNRRIEFTVRTQ